MSIELLAGYKLGLNQGLKKINIYGTKNLHHLSDWDAK